MVVEELKNERVDIISYDDNPEIYIANALSPARITSVKVDEESHFASVTVTDDQLSLAIGKEGQNARLAARLTGWHIDIKSASFSGEPLGEDDDSLIEGEEEVEMCAYVSDEGIRCRNHPRPGSKYCGVHSHLEEA